MPRALVGLLAAVVTLAGCDSAVEDVDAIGDWQLEGGLLDGRPVPLLIAHPITLLVERDEVSGTSACNHYGGRVDATGASFVITELGGTAMGCQPAVMDSEAAFMKALGRVTSAARTDGRLLLSGPGVELRFLAVLPLEPGGIVGTEWVLQSLLSGDVARSVAGEPATLLLDADGTLSGSTGCRTIAGRYGIAGDEVRVSSLLANGTCPAALEAQDAHVVEVIGDGVRATVEETNLTLTDPGGNGLVYRAPG